MVMSYQYSTDAKCTYVNYTTVRNLTRSRTLSLKLHTWLNEKATDSDQSNLVTKLTAVNRKLPSSNGKDQHNYTRYTFV